MLIKLVKLVIAYCFNHGRAFIRADCIIGFKIVGIVLFARRLALESK